MIVPLQVRSNAVTMQSERTVGGDLLPVVDRPANTRIVSTLTSLFRSEKLRVLADLRTYIIIIDPKLVLLWFIEH